MYNTFDTKRDLERERDRAIENETGAEEVMMMTMMTLKMDG